MKTLLTAVILLFTHTFFAQEAQTNTGNSLSAKAQEAFTIKAEAKVNEFFDYLELLTDPKLNADFKGHTAEEAKKLFMDDARPLNIFNKKTSALPLNEIVAIAIKQKSKNDITVSAFTATPVKQTATVQEWLLTYKLRYSGTYLITVTQPFFIITEKKKFGKTTKTVRNTYLGDMVQQY